MYNLVSVSSIKDSISPVNNNSNRPSVDGWSPGQNFISATPRNKPVPTTPSDVANESLEQCSIKKIQQSHHKLLSDLYGETWKSIPSLFKSIQRKHESCNGISKKLQFEDDESDKENVNQIWKKDKELYLTGSDLKNKTGNFSNTEKKSKRKLYTEKIPNIPEPPEEKLLKQYAKATSTPELPKQKSITVNRDVKTTTKKRKNLTVTELVRNLQKDVDSITEKVKSVTVTPKTNDGVKRLSFIGQMKAVQIQYLPAFTTLKLQPMEQGIIKNFKTLYRIEVVRYMLDNMEENKSSTIDVLQAMRMADKAWRNVTANTIRNSFIHCGFPLSSTEEAKVEDICIQPPAEWNKVVSETGISFDDFVTCDDGVMTAGSLSDNEIINSVVQKAETKDLDDIEDPNNTKGAPWVSIKEARTALNTVRNFIEQTSNSEEKEFSALHTLDNAIDRERKNYVKQELYITDSS